MEEYIIKKCKEYLDIWNESRDLKNHQKERYYYGRYMSYKELASINWVVDCYEGATIIFI